MAESRSEPGSAGPQSPDISQSFPGNSQKLPPPRVPIVGAQGQSPAASALQRRAPDGVPELLPSSGFSTLPSKSATHRVIKSLLSLNTSAASQVAKWDWTPDLLLLSTALAPWVLTSLQAESTCSRLKAVQVFSEPSCSLQSSYVDTTVPAAKKAFLSSFWNPHSSTRAMLILTPPSWSVTHWWGTFKTMWTWMTVQLCVTADPLPCPADSEKWALVVWWWSNVWHLEISHSFQLFFG